MTQAQNQTDTDLKAAIVAELGWTPSVNSTNIGVSVNHGAVTLSGEVESYPERRIAEKAAMRVHGVTAIAEELTVRNNWGSTNDTDIARDASHAIDAAINVPAAAVKVAVNNRCITLSGQVAWHYQREAATNAVRYLKGVDEVTNTIVIKPDVSSANIQNSIIASFMRNAQIEGERLAVASDTAGAVTLEGKVGTWAERSQAEHLAWSAPGVTAVDNRIQIQIPRPMAAGR